MVNYSSLCKELLAGIWVTQAAAPPKTPPQNEWWLTKATSLTLPTQLTSRLADRTVFFLQPYLSAFIALEKNLVSYVSFRNSLDLVSCMSFPPPFGKECFSSEEIPTRHYPFLWLLYFLCPFSGCSLSLGNIDVDAWLFHSWLSTGPLCQSNSHLFLGSWAVMSLCSIFSFAKKFPCHNQLRVTRANVWKAIWQA